MSRMLLFGDAAAFGVSDLLVAGCSILFLVWYTKFRYSRRRMYELADKLPNISKMLPLVGNAHQFSGNAEDILKNLHMITEKCGENGGVISAWLGPIFYVAINNPEDVEIVLNNCLEKDMVYKFMQPWLGDGLVSGSVSTWKRHRKTLMPTFNQKILNSFIEVFNNQSDILVKKIEKESKGPIFDAFQYVSPCTLDIICETAMGVTVQAQDNNNHPYIKASTSQMDIIYQRMFKIWLQPEFIFQLTPLSFRQKQNISVLKSFTNGVLKDKKHDYQQSANSITDYTDDEPMLKRKAFLDLMIELSERGGHWTDEELRAEVDTMTIAGNDTTAQASSFTLMMLGAHPEIQDKVVEELYEIFGDSKRDVTKEDLTKMPYLERVIKETLRMFPIAPIVVRRIHKETQIGKYLLPIGAGCVVDVKGLHYRKDIWGEDVNKFIPDRFLPENQRNKHPYSYIPFSAGPRNCIGRQYAMMSMKVLLAKILRSYKITADKDIHAIPLKAEVLLRPVSGHRISIAARD